jgi:hypothetical protein
MTKYILAALALSLSVSGIARAEEAQQKEGETKMKIEDAADQKNKVAGDIDQEITNKKLRAESGSKSKFSLSLEATYSGGGLEKPLAAKRPDLYGRPGTQKVSSMMLGPSIRYRWTKNDSLTFGTSLGVSTPLQGDLNRKKGQARVGDPSLGYGRVGKIGNFQSILSAGVSVATSPESLDINKAGDASASWTLMRTYTNGLSLGVAAQVINQFFSEASGGNKDVTGYGHDDRDDYSVALYPMLEYEFNDRISFRTVARYSTWYHLYGDKQYGRLLHYPGTQSVGIGISVTRDVYLYPNIQFLVEDLNSERTNVAASAIINVF